MTTSTYRVSVVTPFHNAKLHLFEKCIESLKAQTIGFSNIEWIITLHNSEDDFVTAAREMVAGLSNVKVFELYNEHHTASSPRNESMQHVTAPYVFFLDADDFLFPDALEKLVSTMDEHHGDIGSFREESLVGSEGLTMIEQLRLKTLLDQTQPLIVLHRDSPEMANWIDPRNGSVHKMYRTALIRDNGITFDNDVVIGEDITFNLRCLRYAQTVVALPQTIGYGYVMNSGSLVQSIGNEGPDAVMTVLRDSWAWVTAAADCGLDASNVGWIALVRVAKLLSAPGIPAELVEAWRPRFAPFVDVFPPMRGNAKFFSKQETQGIMMLVRSFFATGNAAEVNDNEKLIYWILSNNAGTDIGLKYRFDRIRSYEAFKEAVPLSDYRFYAPLVELTTRIGEVNIFSAEPPIGYSLSSGATGPAKLVPYSARHLESYTRAMRDVISAGEATFALFESLPNAMEYVDGATQDSIVGATLSALRLELVDCSYAKRFKRGALTSPIELLFPDDVLDPRYPRLLFALLDRDVSQIVAPFTWVLLDTMQFLEKYHEQLIRDIETGKMSYGRDIPDAICTQLQTKLKADPERAAELRAAFAEGFEGIIERIWPKCQRIVAAGTGAFRIHTRKLAYYRGSVALSNGYYAASEAMIGRSMGEGSDEYALLTDNAFFEFLKPGSDDPVMVGGVEPGMCYELALTNAAGLYRYRLGDVVRIERIENGVPIFTFAYRLDESILLGDVAVTEDELEAIALAVEKATKVDIRDFCAMDEDGHLVFFAEPAFSESEEEKLLAVPGEELVGIVDGELRQLNAGYEHAREAGAIGTPEVRILEPETHLLYRDRTMFTQRVAPDQIKPVRTLDTDEKRRFFTTLCVQTG